MLLSGVTNKITKRKILHHLFASDDYIDSKQLRTRLYFEWYLGDSMSSDFSIDNDINTIINIGEKFNEMKISIK